MTAGLPALRLVLAAAGRMFAASIEFRTQDGRAAGVQTLRHHLPQGAVWSAARNRVLAAFQSFAYWPTLLANANPILAHACFCGRWRSANECVRLELRRKLSELPSALQQFLLRPLPGVD